MSINRNEETNTNPVFEVKIPLEEKWRGKYIKTAIHEFVQRVTESGGVYCEAGHPVRSEWMSDRQYFERVLAIDELLVIAKITSAVFDDSVLTLRIQGVGDNCEYLESDDVTLGFRSLISPVDHLLVKLITFDVIGKHQTLNPVSLVKLDANNCTASV